MTAFRNLNLFLSEQDTHQLSKRDQRVLDLARTECLNSKSAFKLGAVIAQGKNIIGKGFNVSKTHPIQKEWPTYNHTVHAEMVALLAAQRNPNFNPTKSTLYVYRAGRNNSSKCSFPCKNCWPILEYAGIRRLVCINQNNQPVKIQFKS